MKFNIYSIRSKLALITVGISLFLIVLGGIAYFYFSRIENYASLTTPIASFMSGVVEQRRAEKNFLLKERYDKHFFQSGKSRNLENFDRLFEKNKQNLENLRQNRVVQTLHDTLLLQEIDILDDHLVMYRDLVHNLVSKIKERGYLSYGIAGEWQKLGEKLSQKTTTLQNEALTSTMLSVRLEEKNYLLRKKEEHIKAVKSQTDLLKEQIRQTDTLSTSPFAGLTPVERMELINQIDAYQRYAGLLFQKDKEIGSALAEKGLQKELELHLAEIEQHAAQIMERVKEISFEQARKAKQTLVFLVFVLTLLTVFVLSFVARTITRPIQKTHSFIDKLSKGHFPDKLILKNRDEITSMLKRLNKFIDSLKEKTEFASQIGKGNLEVKFTALSQTDVLGNALVEMKKSLQKNAQEQQKNKIEEEKRHWTTVGLARFGDILRRNEEDIKTLAINILDNLINYLNANQAALFIINDDDPEETFVEQIGTIAYNRKRKIKQRFDTDEGLIGRCIEEGETIYMTNLPDSYVEITSGLGSENPRALLIVPLKLNEKIFGVVEMASFKEFEPHHIEFVEKVGENIASTLSSVKINQNTKRLLEQAQEQAEELAAQEEEMRQNLEELQATQEDAARREAEMNSLLESINASAFSLEFDLNGKILKTSNIAEEILQKSDEELIGSFHAEWFQTSEKEEKIYNALWAEVKSGEIKRKTSQLQVAEKTIWLDESYSPIYDNEERVQKILLIATDITESRQLAENLKAEQQELKEQEEEMRQQFEILSATKEEFTQKQQEQQQKIEQLEAEIEQKQQKIEELQEKLAKQ